MIPDRTPFARERSLHGTALFAVRDEPAAALARISALGLELLAHEALAGDDRGAARHCARELLELGTHPAARDCASRVFAEFDLANGAADTALRRTEMALARAPCRVSSPAS